jgi:hypothetical protein
MYLCLGSPTSFEVTGDLNSEESRDGRSVYNPSIPSTRGAAKYFATPTRQREVRAFVDAAC